MLREFLDLCCTCEKSCWINCIINCIQMNILAVRSILILYVPLEVLWSRMIWPSLCWLYNVMRCCLFRLSCISFDLIDWWYCHIIAPLSMPWVIVFLSRIIAYCFVPPLSVIREAADKLHHIPDIVLLCAGNLCNFLVDPAICAIINYVVLALTHMAKGKTA